MTERFESQSKSRAQYLSFAVVSVLAVAFAAVLSVSHRSFFQPYFGHLNPLLVIVLVVLSGFVGIAYLQSSEWTGVLAKGKCVEGFLFSAILASLFGVVVILVDLVFGFPNDINVPLPQSLFFYPAMAYVAEVVFHILPLAIIFMCFGPFIKNQHEANRSYFVWYCIIFVSVLEPVFHISVAVSSPSFSGLDVYVGLHVFSINFLQLMIFRRYGFASMFSFRLFYYLVWHIAWGHLRLPLAV